MTRPSGNADLGYDVAGVATIVTPGGLNIGAEIGFGKISYDLAPLAAMNNGYTAFKPFVSYRISDTAEVILSLLRDVREPANPREMGVPDAPRGLP